METLEEEMAENRQERGPFAYIVPESRLRRVSELAVGLGAACGRLGNLPGSVVILCDANGRKGARR